METKFVVICCQEDSSLRYVMIPKGIWRLFSIILPEAVQSYTNKNLTELNLSETKTDRITFFTKNQQLHMTFCYVNIKRKQMQTTMKLKDKDWFEIQYILTDINDALFNNLTENGDFVIEQYKWMLLNEENILIDESEPAVFDKDECIAAGEAYVLRLKDTGQVQLKIKQIDRIIPDFFHQLFMWIYLYVLQQDIHLLSKQNCNCITDNHNCLTNWELCVKLYHNIAQMRIQFNNLADMFDRILTELNCSCTDKFNIINSCTKFVTNKTLEYNLLYMDIPTDFHILFGKVLQTKN